MFLEDSSRITWEGCSVLLDINDGDRLLFSRLTAGSILKIGNQSYPLQPLIGYPFGSLFQVDNASLSPISLQHNNNNNNNNNNNKDDDSRDNRSLIDNNTAQTLTANHIQGLRSQGVSGNEIVEALIANSATFENKTSFSQEKYRLKKQKKYAPKIHLRRPFARSICDTYFKKYPTRIGDYILTIVTKAAKEAAHEEESSVSSSQTSHTIKAVHFEQALGTIKQSVSNERGC